MTAEKILREEIEGHFSTSDLTRCVALALREMHKRPGFRSTFFKVMAFLGLAEIEVRGYADLYTDHYFLTQKGQRLYLQLAKEGYYKDD
ncbi:hypothetical protein HYX16_00725 [Candidatus Woesearchaeota archaeon]|nr:hypothetical protein [Candidatus Woesearchaeota archaeon]